MSMIIKKFIARKSQVDCWIYNQEVKDYYWGEDFHIVMYKIGKGFKVLRLFFYRNSCYRVLGIVAMPDI